MSLMNDTASSSSSSRDDLFALYNVSDLTKGSWQVKARLLGYSLTTSGLPFAESCRTRYPFSQTVLRLIHSPCSQPCARNTMPVSASRNLLSCSNIGLASEHILMPGSPQFSHVLLRSGTPQVLHHQSLSGELIGTCLHSRLLIMRDDVLSRLAVFDLNSLALGCSLIERFQERQCLF